MEAFEQFVALDLEADGLVVSEAIKFPVTRRTRRADRPEVQTHGYEVDLIGARSDLLVLATVKSFFGSRGVHVREVSGAGGNTKAYALLNDSIVRDGVVNAACEGYGYRPDQLRIRLYVGKFAGSAKADQEAAVREWCSTQWIGGGPIEVRSLPDIIEKIRRVSSSTMYRDNAVIVTMKVLSLAGLLTQEVAATVSDDR
jgi:hypothetical protein